MARLEELAEAVARYEGASRLNPKCAERRAIWAIRLISWALLTLTPKEYTKQIAQWAAGYAADLDARLIR